ncbi:MAG: hypothetical protein NZM29_05230, partial [Nitrospira sp.]|nr:hypothetical protein [Nitrospira sp.]
MKTESAQPFAERLRRFVSPTRADRRFRSFPSWMAGLGAAGLFLCFSVFGAIDGEARPKPDRIPRQEPELKIVDLKIDPVPFEPGNGPLQIMVTVQLPKELDGASILEVTSLISSPSKTSIRFLSHRQPVEVPQADDGVADRPRLSVELFWDGQDHRKQQAAAGVYSYEVRTKLLADGEKGP